jgi:prepilin-type N-terminal cleavage/methylation domain-containing protein
MGTAISKNHSGFTLIEVMVVIAIFGMLFLMGLFFDFSFYRGTSFGTDTDNYASVLRRARAMAINNINGRDQGVHLLPDSYVLFQCPLATPGCLYSSRDVTLDHSISRNPGLNFSATTPSDIVFSRLSGDSNFEGIVTVSGFGKTATININNEGLINR